jgi:SAM-dependent methyltransferase
MHGFFLDRKFTELDESCFSVEIPILPLAIFTCFVQNYSMDYTNTMERWSGFADQYARFRPAPPKILAGILIRMAGVVRPDLVVDLGSGTGLSTRYWEARAQRVIGVEPSKDMRAQAVADTDLDSNVSYRDGYGNVTGLDEGSADIVTCAQSLHWMEPLSTFTEAARILREGGVFAAYDYDWPPLTGSWQVGQAWDEVLSRVLDLEREMPVEKSVTAWDKPGHLKRMRESGMFRYVHEFAVHHIDEGNTERFIGLLLSQGGVMTQLKAGKSEEDLGLDRFRAVAGEHLGDKIREWVWTSRVRIGVK